MEDLHIAATYNVVCGSPFSFVEQEVGCFLITGDWLAPVLDLEMLFLSPKERGKGLGKQLLLYGIHNYGIEELTVNEQNPQAVGFYEHMGFETYKRTDLDEEGNPYPLLYMKIELRM